MTTIEKIRQEIERRIKLYSVTNEKEQWIVNTYWSVLSYLDTIQVDEPEGSRGSNYTPPKKKRRKRK